MAAKMAAIFIENACTPLKAAKTCFSFGVGSNCYL